MARRVLPSKDYLEQCFRYDPETGDLTWLIRPTSHFATRKGAAVFNTQFSGKAFGCPWTAPGKKTYRAGTLNRKVMLAHRIIWRMVTGDDADMVDHRDGNGLNNRFVNLRAASNSQNLMNQGARTTKKSRLPKGVTQPPKGRLMAQITVNGQRFYLGRFNTPEEAAAAYREAADRLHGEFANYGQG